MSMTVGGIDLVLNTPRSSFDLNVVLAVLLDFWPDAQIEDADGPAFRPLREVFQSDRPWHSREFFVYRDTASAASWTANGATSDNRNRMVHVLIQDAPEGVKTTLVVDELWDEMLAISGEMQQALLPRVPNTNGNGRRIAFQKELRAAGSSLTRAEFLGLVAQVHRTSFPAWTVDELLCQPREARRFCRLVRSKARAVLPDRVIIKALLSLRKRRAS